MELTVTDNEGSTGKDTTNINVILPGEGDPNNLPPVASAGPDFSVSSNSTILNAWGSYDPEEKPITFSWKKIAGPDSYNIIYEGSSTPMLSNLVNGTYTFQLTVTDVEGAIATDEV